MQSTLRTGVWIFVAVLLFGSSTSAATLKTVKHQPAHPRARVTGYFGIASWYGPQHQGRKMANGQRFDRNKLTAASWYFPLGTSVRVTNIGNGKTVVVTITDRGPNRRLHRVLDLSEAAARRLDYIGVGLTRVYIYPLKPLDTESSPNEANLQQAQPGNNGQEIAAMAPVPLP